MIIFLVSFLIAFYTYLGYPIILILLVKVRKKRPEIYPVSDDQLPAVTFFIAAYNEERFIQQKIQNTLSLSYPADKLEVVVVSDGSSDRTAEIASQFKTIKFYDEKQRRGKINVTNKFIPLIKTPIVVFSDANTFLNEDALRKVVRHYEDKSIGGVAGEKRIVENKEDKATGSGEGLYLKYESYLKMKDSQLYSMVGATGELFSLRTSLYEPPPANMVIEDFYITLKIPAKGFRFVYEPQANATESASASMADEWKRKVRITAGAFQAIVALRELLNPFKYKILTFQFFSHRVMRWTLAPLSLPVILISNIYLAITGAPLFKLILLCQLAFYFIAILGYVYRTKKVSIKGFFAPYYFIVMNLSVYFGFFRYLKGEQTVTWEKSNRD